VDVAFNLEQRHGALSESRNGTAHWHSTLGVEMGPSFWGGLFICIFRCTLFSFLRCAVDVGMKGWHLGTGREKSAVRL
jgi:hypothetical protein